MELQHEIVKAIRNRKVIKIYYRGGHRVVEPFLIGYHKTTGKLLLRGFFLDGVSSSGEYNTWKLYDVESIDDLEILDDGIVPTREYYNPQDKDMGEIIESV